MTFSLGYAIIYTEQREGHPKLERKNKMLIAKNKLEEKVLEMVHNHQPIKGWARDILIDMTLRENEEENKEGK